MNKEQVLEALIEIDSGFRPMDDVFHLSGEFGLLNKHDQKWVTTKHERYRVERLRCACAPNEETNIAIDEAQRGECGRRITPEEFDWMMTEE